MNKYWFLEMLPQDIQNLSGWDRVQAARSYFENLGIKFKQPYQNDKTHALGHLAVLAYDQLSPNHHLLLNRISRGLTLDIRDFSVVSRPFERFFNYGEKDTVEYLKMVQQSESKIEVVEKVDGSMMRLFYEPSVDKWLLHTRLSYAESPLPLNMNMSYSMAFVHALKGEFSEIDRNELLDVNSSFYHGHISGGYDAHMYINEWAKMENLNKEYTYIFELCTPFNEAVVRHKGISLYFLGKSKNHPDKSILLERKDWVFGDNQKNFAANTFNNHQLSVKAGLGLKNQLFKNFYIKNPLRAELGTPQAMEIIALNDNKVGYEHEGHILYIDGIPSVKIKSESYVNLHHNVSNELTFKNAVDCIRMGEYAEMVAYHPEAKPLLDNIQNHLDSLMKETNTLFDEYCEKYGLNPNTETFPVNQMDGDNRKKLFKEEIPKISNKMINKWVSMRLTRSLSVEDCVRKTPEKDFYLYMSSHFKQTGNTDVVDKHRNVEHKSTESLEQHKEKMNQQYDVIYHITKNFPVKQWDKQDFYNLAQKLQTNDKYCVIWRSIAHYLRYSVKDDIFNALNGYVKMENDGKSLCKLIQVDNLAYLNHCLMFL